MRIVHVIVGLGDGGAERTLFKLVTNDHVNTHEVISLTSLGKYGPLLRREGITCEAMRWKNSRSIQIILRLTRALRSSKPEVVNAWMPHSALLVSLLWVFIGRPGLFWSIRATDYGRGLRSTPTRLVISILALLSNFVPKKIFVVGQRALEKHVAWGFSKEKMVHIPNGYRIQSLVEHNSVAARIVEPSHRKNFMVFGMVARYHPQKNHKGLLLALSRVIAERDDWILKLVGSGVSESNRELVEQIESLGLSKNVFLVGQVDEPERIYRTLDVHILPSSFGEGFPNVVAESMLAGVPNLVSDVGDSARVVGDTGWVVPPNSSQALVDTILLVLNCGQEELLLSGMRARERIEQNFSLDAMVENYVREYRKKRLVVFPRYSSLGASSRVRLFQFENSLRRSGWDVFFYPFSNDNFLVDRYQGRRSVKVILGSYLRRFAATKEIARADLVLIEKELFPWVPSWFEKRFVSAKKVVYDFDDAVHEQFREHTRATVRAFLGRKITRTVSKARAVIAGNPNLKSFFEKEVGVASIVIPSSVDLTSLNPSGIQTADRQRPPVFGWIGTPITFQAYLAPLLPMFVEILESVDGELRIMGAGNALNPNKRTSFYPWSESAEGSFLKSIDVGIMPLSDDPWSRGKCGYKLLQYMGAGKPSIASPVGVNNDIIVHGVSGYLVAEHSDWAKYMSSLTLNPLLRKKMGEAASQTVAERYSSDVVSGQIVGFLSDLVATA